MIVVALRDCVAVKAMAEGGNRRHGAVRFISEQRRASSAKCRRKCSSSSVGSLDEDFGRCCTSCQERVTQRTEIRAIADLCSAKARAQPVVG